MKYGDKLTFWCLINENEVQIPEIQRDYVQGRNTDIVRRNKESLIQKMVSAVVKLEPVDLNFTYGKKNNRYFIPIDGQQRLTTLFLFHFYLSVAAGKIANDKFVYQRFSYKTRRTSDKFLTLLLTHSEDLSGATNISDSIEFSSWYLNSFKHDLTILSMLDVLKQIEKEFNENGYHDWDTYYNNLFKMNESGCPLTFMFIDFDMTGNDNELYVKMNSRGKQLTDFENFKSDLYEFIENPIEGLKFPTAQRMDEVNRELVSMISAIDMTQFKERIDGKWLDTFWTVQAISNDDFYKKHIDDRALYIDTLFKNLVHYLYLNNLALSGICDCNEVYKTHLSPQDEWGQKKVVGMLFLDQYINDKELDVAIGCRKCLINTINDFAYVMNYFSDDSNLITEFLHLLNSKGRLVREFNLNAYKDRLYLAVLCALGGNGVKISDSEFTFYKRTMKNILINTEVDSERRFIDFIKGIQNSSGSILSFKNCTLNVSQNYQFDGSFDKYICDEEKLKNTLRYQNPGLWENAITNAEGKAKDYLHAQIGFLFDFLDITAADINSNAKEKDFERYADALGEVFEYYKESEKSNYLHRTLLVYAAKNTIDPLLIFSKRNNNIYSFCSNREDDFKHRKHDWRGQLLENKHFKSVFKDMYAGYVDYKTRHPGSAFADFAQNEIDNYTEKYDDSSNMLISVIVKYDWVMPFKNGTHKYYFLKDNQSFSFLKTTQRNEMMDVHLYYLKTLLEQMGYSPKNSFDENGMYIINLPYHRDRITFNTSLNKYEVCGTSIAEVDANALISKLQAKGLI